MHRRPPVDLESATFAEVERAAAEVLDANIHGCCATGARERRTLAENEAGWEAWWFRPCRLSGVHEVSVATRLLDGGHHLGAPLGRRPHRAPA